MKSKSKFVIGIAAAALTFGTLMATLGQENFKRHLNHCGQTDNCGSNNEGQKHTDHDNSEKTESGSVDQ